MWTVEIMKCIIVIIIINIIIVIIYWGLGGDNF